MTSDFPPPLPAPRTPISIRAATMDDLAFIDSLQKMHTKQVGFMPRGQLEGKIRAGHVLVAEGVPGHSSLVIGQDEGQRTNDKGRVSGPVGYVIGHDQYFKHDDVGIIYQLNVAPAKQRGFIGAALLKAMFERAAYGCKLFCCWCAQDIEANRFWEAMGFVPLAFRAGSEKKSRVHIFWQKRIRAGDHATPWWFPAKTGAGALREDRVVLPIPPGRHWSEEMPRILPEVPVALEDQRGTGKGRRAKSLMPMAGPVKQGPRQFGPPPTSAALVQTIAEQAKPKPPKKPKRKADPNRVGAARELRDRWLEKVNAADVVGCGKYDVSRELASSDARNEERHRLLAA